MPFSGGYNYGMGYNTSGDTGMTGPYDAAASGMDTEQNYGYNYTPDSKYYKGFDYSGKTAMDAGAPISSQMPAGTGSETMNQYYAQSNMMDPKMYMGNNQ